MIYGRAPEYTEGTACGYVKIHRDVRKIMKAACELCGSGDQLQAALRHNAPAERLLIDPTTGCLYSTETCDYHALCIPCHRRLDLVEGRPACAKGHEYTAKSTSINPDGSRRCLTCHNNRERARNATPEGRAARQEQGRRYRKSNPLTDEQKAHKLELQRNRRSAEFEGNR
jgi:hypothetical protein